ncbi:CRISPR-associated endonuclease Cas2 [Syntrophotalea acetylenica]|jgi:CRISPR-associated protein Cas2|uniref:CRISPR-associated endonuclease Cas2 n=1 Tax=Syntrophotalea acetylenica TaxID=29542 RepID=UPI002A36679A|nr:CRISPR-associated endonuclease Cas2 [Syntrophotalea acetylenica]MDY0261386.1 CRISPR-associated endonuclease Cas2 [Syntrophotalea acetylenica]
MDLLIAYDIANPRRLQRVARIMLDYGTRVQKSIFEVSISERAFTELRRRTEKELDASEDGVKYFPLCARCSEVWLNIGYDASAGTDSPWLVV